MEEIKGEKAEPHRLPGVNRALGQALYDLLGGPANQMGEVISQEIRLFQWKRALSIIKKAEQKKKERGISTHEVPYKFLVPFIEKASCEYSDQLEDRWSELLLSAVRDFQEEHLSYIDYVSKIGPTQAQILDRMSAQTRYRGETPHVSVWGLSEKSMVLALNACRTIIWNQDGSTTYPDEKYVTQKQFLNNLDGMFALDDYQVSQDGDFVYLCHARSSGDDVLPLIRNVDQRDRFENIRLVVSLESLGLVQTGSVFEIYETEPCPVEGYEVIEIAWASLSPLGYHLIEACGG